jgi:hypothetical protein
VAVAGVARILGWISLSNSGTHAMTPDKFAALQARHTCLSLLADCEFDDGWHELFDGLCWFLDGFKAVRVVQAKEKFGRMRVYLDVGTPDDAYHACWLAESMSGKVCEVCGEDGLVREKNGWLTTRCDGCFGGGGR